MMIRELQKHQIQHNRPYNRAIDTSLNFGDHKETRPKIVEKPINEISKKTILSSEKKDKKMSKKLLPLKYLATELQQNYLLLPRIGGKPKPRNKNLTITEGNKFFIEGKSRIKTMEV